MCRAFVTKMGRVKLKYYAFLLLILLIFLVDYMGFMLHFRELDFDAKFRYPLEGDIQKWMTQLKKGESPDQPPINKHDYFFLKHAKGKCLEEDGVHYVQLRVVFIVKSAIDHFDNRRAIRRTWGFERRFSDVNIRTVFLLGRLPKPDVDIQARVEEEAAKFRDIVQGDFEDTYFNNTLKTMMGLRWAVEQCPTSRFYFFVDDDYYVSTRNVLRFLRNPVNYPQYLEEPVLSFDDNQDNHFRQRQLKQMINFDIPEDVKLFAGYVIQSAPHRHKLSKWFVTLEEYPYHMWPPYVTAGAYVLSREALLDMYYASFFVQRFRFDDVYLGIVAKKVGLEPYHCGEFHFDKKPYSIRSYQYVVASHGYSNPIELERVWNQQKEAGNT